MPTSGTLRKIVCLSRLGALLLIAVEHLFYPEDHSTGRDGEDLPVHSS